MCLHCLFLAIILEILLSSIQKCHSWAQHSTLTPQLSQNITKTLHWVVSIYAFYLSFYRSLKPRFLSPQRENKESRSPRSGAVDLPVVTDSIRNIKSMWEKGNVFSSPGSGGSTFKVKKKKKKVKVVQDVRKLLKLSVCMSERRTDRKEPSSLVLPALPRCQWWPGLADLWHCPNRKQLW